MHTDKFTDDKKVQAFSVEISKQNAKEVDKICHNTIL